MQVIYKLTGNDVRHRIIEWSLYVARGVTRSFGLARGSLESGSIVRVKG